GGEGQHLVRFAADLPGGGGTHCQSIDSALCARTRVGVARVDDEGAHAVFVEKVRFGDVDGRGTETVGREDCTDGAAGGYGNQCQVGMPGLLHACL
ncbi:hypothetical protein LN386_29235, partial [Enterobacter hormaechei subsp. steigerwaltii]|nr:hypothetical protein [Enterobacter hormaechei subsp. steigerwaltii]